MGVGGQNFVEFGPRSCWMAPYKREIYAKLCVT